MITETLLRNLQYELSEKLVSGKTIPRILHEIRSEVPKKLAALLLAQDLQKTPATELKKTIVNTAANYDFEHQDLDFYDWLIVALGLKDK